MDRYDFAALWVSATGAIAVGAWVCVQLWRGRHRMATYTRAGR